MKSQAFLEFMSDLEKEAKLKREALIAKYALANSDVQFGDIISDGKVSIRVELIMCDIYGEDELPSCRFRGAKVKKNGMTFSSLKRAMIYQNDIVK